MVIRTPDPDIGGAIQSLELATRGTVVVAEICPPEDAADCVRLRWSNADHLFPVLLDPDGTARLLIPSRRDADLRRVLDPADPRTTTETATLPFGSTLLLVTDGLVERRGESLDDGVARLLRLVEKQPAGDLDQLCDAIVDGMVPRAADDVATVVVQPRPIAGEDGAGRAARVGASSDQQGRSRAGYADQELWGRRPPPARPPESSVLGRWQPRIPADLTSSRRQLAEAASAVARPSAEAAERLELVFEELVSNGFRHGQGRLEVTVTATTTGWLLEVVDGAGNTPPSPAIDRDAALGGLGLHLVARLSSARGWMPTTAGRKVVWAHVDGRPGVSAEDSASAGPHD